MPTGDIVSSEGKEYLLAEPLKAGMIGIVYKATYQDETKAVKVPVPNLSPEGRVRFWQEYDILIALADRMAGANLTVPKVAKGKLVGRGEQVLLLEFVPEETGLTSEILRLLKQGGLDSEILAVKAAVQYAQLLKHLHSINYTCPDRKLADLRWIDGRLIVLDWNVVEEGNLGRTNDLYLFGTLWYQLMTGRYPSSNLNPLDDSIWRDGQITYGTRRLLIRALNKEYTTSEDIEKIFQERLDLFNQNNVAEEAKSLYQQYIQPLNEVVDLEQEWQALDKLDLVFRETNTLQTERDEALRRVRIQGDKLVSPIKQAFENTKYDQGKTAIMAALKVADERQNSKLKLQIARSRVLIEGGQSSLKEGIAVRSYRNNLLKATEELEKLDKPDIANPQHVVDDIVRLLDNSGLEINAPQTETEKKFADFYREAQIWKYVSQAEKNSREDNYDQAIADIEDAKKYCEEMVVYREELRAVLPDFDVRRKEYEDIKRNQERLKKWDEKTKIKSISGQREQIGYMLARLPLLAPLINDVEVVETKRDTLTQLASLYRLTAYAHLSPHFWPDALQVLSDILENKELEPLWNTAEEVLKDSYEEANDLVQLRTQFGDDLAAKIYKKGLEIQRKLT